MKTVAIVANVGQLAIIWLIFYLRGSDLGGLVIGLLLLLMAVPFVNVLSAALTQPKKQATAPPPNPENGIIKREAMRILYPEERCPTLTTAGSSFAVRDLSEGGVCIRAASATPFKRRINGRLHLLSGDVLRFRASILRRGEGEVVLGFSTPVGTATLSAERQALADDDGA